MPDNNNKQSQPSPGKGTPEQSLIEMTLTELDKATKQPSLRTLFRSHLLQTCGSDKVKEFNDSADRYKRYIVSFLAQKTITDVFANFAQELAKELNGQ